jgi:hypothetical protein
LELKISIEEKKWVINIEQEAQGRGAQLTLTGSRQGKKPDFKI